MTRQTQFAKILIVDNNLATCRLLSQFFQYHQYTTAYALTAKSTRELLISFNPDLVILDLNLPDTSGFHLCREISSQNRLLLILTALTDTYHIVNAFENGADDYLFKPFNLEVVQVHLQALLKRHLIKEGNVSPLYLHYDGLIIDNQKWEVTLKGQPLDLTPVQFNLLYTLAVCPHQVFDRISLSRQLWHNKPNNDPRKIDVHIVQLRRKIGDIKGEVIQTIRGKGYIFNPEKIASLQLLTPTC